MVWFYVLYFTVIINCCDSTPSKSWSAGYTTDELERYRTLFSVLTSSEPTVPVVIVSEFTDMRDLTAYTIGVCYSDNDKGLRVEVLESFWTSADDMSRETLVLHELIHCELGYFRHNSALGLDGCPQSLMYPSLVHPYCFAKHRLSYYARIQDGHYRGPVYDLEHATAGDKCNVHAH